MRQPVFFSLPSLDYFMYDVKMLNLAFFELIYGPLEFEFGRVLFTFHKVIVGNNNHERLKDHTFTF